jgi:hypothetical protein
MGPASTAAITDLSIPPLDSITLTTSRASHNLFFDNLDIYDVIAHSESA